MYRHGATRFWRFEQSQHRLHVGYDALRCFRRRTRSKRPSPNRNWLREHPVRRAAGRLPAAERAEGRVLHALRKLFLERPVGSLLDFSPLTLDDWSRGTGEPAAAAAPSEPLASGLR